MVPYMATFARNKPRDSRRQERAAYARMAPKSWNEDDLTVELVWTTGAAVERWGYIEVLEVSEEAVDLSRLNNGAPLLDVHNSWSLKSQIGVVLSAKIEGDIGTAVVQLSSREELEWLRRDIAEGVIRNVSVGYDHIEWTDSKNDDGTITRTVTRWLPVELSLVPVPADAGGQTRGEQGMPHDREYRSDEDEDETDVENADESEEETADDEGGAEGSDEENDDDADEENDDDADGERSRSIARRERMRIRGIKECAKALGLKASSDEVRKLIDNDTPIGKARDLLVRLKVKKQKESKVQGNHRGATVGREEEDNFTLGLAEALAYRAAPHLNELTERARPFVHMRLTDMFAQVLERHTGRSWRGRDPGQIFKRAMRLRTDGGRMVRHEDGRKFRDGATGMHTTGDFPYLLADVMNKSLQNAYQLQDRTFTRWARPGVLSDFKATNRVQLGSVVELKKLTESGEISAGSFGEKNEQMQLVSYGVLLAFSRQMMINDDLSAFGRLPQIAANSTAQLESNLVYGTKGTTGLMVNSGLGPVMAETGEKLFDAAHSNIGTAGAPSITVLKELHALLGEQFALDGVTPLNSGLDFIIAGVEDALAWDQILGAGRYPDSPDNKVPARLQNIDVIQEARVGIEGSRYFAGSKAGDTYEYATLAGHTGPRVEFEEMFTNDGVQMRVLHDFGCGPIDYRFLATNAGA